MITSFKCKDTEKLFAGKRVARFVHFESVVLRKLQQIHAATDIHFLRVRLPIIWSNCTAIAQVSTAYGSTHSGGFVLCGMDR